ncbi:hypothetical protein [Ulvibacter antarcticus]|uniref:Uncharacterized protein n=1 Tax=Ulvibacter antarcticus TaxID=442714 RepID=A0A3L9YVP9_9FLAO|nr:hypothetical protein [Ulvibacter antarcticus]RMA58542.1 hypothetical protein BXY75_1915 [Ulvibacter antarcticus]
MKKFSVILVAFVLLLGTSLSATTLDKEKVKKTTAQEMGTLLKNPHLTLIEDQNVNVTFIVNKDREIVVLSVGTDNESIESFIKNRLNYEKLDNKLTVGKKYIQPVKILKNS